jgi:hypothetical protein
MYSESIGLPPDSKSTPFRHIDSHFFRAVILLLVLLVLAGFAPSYYLRALNTAPLPLTTLMHLHGFVFTLWILLLVTQSLLAGSGSMKLHRRLGFASIPLAISMMGAAGMLAYSQTLVWIDDPSFDYYEVLAFLATPFTTIVFFSMLYTLAILNRKRPAIHKRLILIATLDLCTPAISRLPLIGPMATWTHYVAIDLFLLALLVHDWRALRRPHPSTVIGGLALVASQYGREWLGWTDTWLDFAIWLTS